MVLVVVLLIVVSPSVGFAPTLGAFADDQLCGTAERHSFLEGPLAEEPRSVIDDTRRRVRNASKAHGRRQKREGYGGSATGSGHALRWETRPCAPACAGRAASGFGEGL